MVEVINKRATSFKMPHVHTVALSAPDYRPMPQLETPRHPLSKSDSSSFGVTSPFSLVLVCTRFCLCPPRVCFLNPVEVLVVL